MSKNETKLFQDELPRQLAEALTAIADNTVMKKFLRDILTEKEIIEISARLEAARMLEAGETYKDIVAKTNLSSRTVARISAWLRGGAGGYRAVLDIVGTHHGHISPVRAE